MANDDRDALIFTAYSQMGVEKVRIAYLFRLSVGRINQIIAHEQTWRDKSMGDLITHILPSRTPFLDKIRAISNG